MEYSVLDATIVKIVGKVVESEVYKLFIKIVEGKAMLQQVLIELFDGLEMFQRTENKDQFFKDICAKFGLQNLAYLGVNLPKKTNQNYFIHNTYSKDWAYRYETENYVSVDPIVRRGLVSLLPIDWNEFKELNSAQRKMFGEASDFSVGRQGLTFPLYGLRGETATFSITADLSDKEWKNFKFENLRYMRIVGDFFHQKIVGDCLSPDSLSPRTLTNRERECLRWSGEGKSQKDIGDILGVTPRTVRFFLEGARHKLGCLNTTHTVTSAMLRGLL